MDDVNAGVRQLLGNLDEAPKPEPVKDGPPVEFKFNTAKDKVGLPLEHPSYVKPRCKLCGGKGYRIFLIGDGYGTSPKDGSRHQLKSRNLLACACVHRNYSKTRLEFEKKVEDIMGGCIDKGDLREKAQENVRKRVLSESFPHLL